MGTPGAPGGEHSSGSGSSRQGGAHRTGLPRPPPDSLIAKACQREPEEGAVRHHRDVGLGPLQARARRTAGAGRSRHGAAGVRGSHLGNVGWTQGLGFPCQPLPESEPQRSPRHHPALSLAPPHTLAHPPHRPAQSRRPDLAGPHLHEPLQELHPPHHHVGLTLQHQEAPSQRHTA